MCGPLLLDGETKQVHTLPMGEYERDHQAPSDPVRENQAQGIEVYKGEDGCTNQHIPTHQCLLHEN